MEVISAPVLVSKGIDLSKNMNNKPEMNKMKTRDAHNGDELAFTDDISKDGHKDYVAGQQQQGPQAHDPAAVSHSTSPKGDHADGNSHGHHHSPPPPPPRPIDDPNQPAVEPAEPITELNPLILQADLDFVSTPLTAKYTASSIAALNTVQQECAVDYMKNCLFPTFASSLTSGDNVVAATPAEGWMSLNANNFFNPAVFMTKPKKNDGNQQSEDVLNRKRHLTASDIVTGTTAVSRAPLLSLKHQFHQVMDAKNLIFDKPASIATADHAAIKTTTKPVAVAEESEGFKKVKSNNRLERNKFSSQVIKPDEDHHRHLRWARAPITGATATGDVISSTASGITVTSKMVKDMTTALGAALATEDEYVPEGEPVPANLLKPSPPVKLSESQWKQQRRLMNKKMDGGSKKMTMMHQEQQPHHIDEEEEEEDVDSDQEEDEEEEGRNESMVVYEDEDLEYYADITDMITEDPNSGLAVTAEPTLAPSRARPHPPPHPPLPPLPPCGSMAFADVMPPRSWMNILMGTYPPPPPPCDPNLPSPDVPPQGPPPDDTNHPHPPPPPPQPLPPVPDQDPHHHHHNHDGDNDNNDEDHHHHHDGGDDHHHPPPPPPPHPPVPPSSSDPFAPYPMPPVPEDTTYTGSLGYGTAGDQCMLEHFNAQVYSYSQSSPQQKRRLGIKHGNDYADEQQPAAEIALLSSGCQQAISDVYTLRAEYFNEYAMAADPHHPPMPPLILPVFLLLMVMAVFARRMYRYPYRKYRRQQINNVLSVLEANPQLKAAVEAETGTSLPEKLCMEGNAGRHVNGRHGGFWNKVLRVLGLLFSAFVLAMTSVVLTANIVMAHYDATGEITSPPVAGGMLLVVLLFELAGVYLVYKGVRFVVNRDVSGGSGSGRQPSSSSAAAGYDDNNNGNNNNGNGENSSAHVFGQRILYAYNDIVTRIAGSSGSQSQSSHTLYTPLTSDMDSSRERGEGEIVYAPSAPTVITRTMYHQPAATNTSVHNPMNTLNMAISQPQPPTQQYVQPQYTSLAQQPPVVYYAPRVAAAHPVSSVNMM